MNKLKRSFNLLGMTSLVMLLLLLLLEAGAFIAGFVGALAAGVWKYLWFKQ